MDACILHDVSQSFRAVFFFSSIFFFGRRCLKMYPTNITLPPSKSSLWLVICNDGVALALVSISAFFIFCLMGYRVGYRVVVVVLEFANTCKPKWHHRIAPILRVFFCSEAAVSAGTVFCTKSYFCTASRTYNTIHNKTTNIVCVHTFRQGQAKFVDDGTLTNKKTGKKIEKKARGFETHTEKKNRGGVTMSQGADDIKTLLSRIEAGYQKLVDSACTPCMEIQKNSLLWVGRRESMAQMDGGGMQRVVRDVERLDRLIDSVGMFSSNEEKDDLTELSMRCLLVPYYRAELMSKQLDGSAAAAGGGGSAGGGEVVVVVEGRKKALHVCLNLHKTAFLGRCLQYGVLEGSVRERVEMAVGGEGRRRGRRQDDDGDGGGGGNVGSMGGGRMDAGTARRMKIESFKQERELKKQIEAFGARASSRYAKRTRGAGGGGEEADDDDEDGEEDRRAGMLLALNLYALRSCNAIEVLQKEISLLSECIHGNVMEKIKNSDDGRNVGGETLVSELRQAVARLSVIGDGVTKREEVRRQVFRPSHVLPSMTVEQFGALEYAEMQRNAQMGLPVQDNGCENDQSDDEDVYKVGALSWTAGESLVYAETRGDIQNGV